MIQIKYHWVSLKNYNWPSNGKNKAHMPIFEKMLCSHTIFGPIRLKIFMGTQKIIIYLLVMRNPGYDAYFLIFDILGIS